MKVETIGYAISVIAVLPFFVGGALNLSKNPTAMKNLQGSGLSRIAVASIRRERDCDRHPDPHSSDCVFRCHPGYWLDGGSHSCTRQDS